MRLIIIFCLIIFPENSGCGTDGFFEIIAKCRSVFEPAGESNFCNGVGGGAKHLGRNTDAVLQEVLFRREFYLLHKYFVQIGAVNAYMPGNIGNPDIVGIIVVNIFLCLLEILMGVIFFFGNRDGLHAGKKKKEVSKRI